MASASDPPEPEIAPSALLRLTPDAFGESAKYAGLERSRRRGLGPLEINYIELIRRMLQTKGPVDSPLVSGAVSSSTDVAVSSPPPALAAAIQQALAGGKRERQTRESQTAGDVTLDSGRCA